MDLFKLIELQKIDKKLMDLESVKGDLPEQVEELKANLTDLYNKLAKTRDDYEITQKMKREYQADIETLTEKLNKYQEQIYSVKNNKEYDAITIEIENLEKQIDEIELKSVELLENEEKQSEAITQFGTKVNQVKENLQAKENELQQKLSKTEAEEKVLSNKRKEVVSAIDYRLISTYNRIRKGRDGIALTTIKNYNCTSCFTTIPAQTVVEVRKMNQLISCEVCGRILVYDNNGQVVQEKIETE